MIKKIAKQIPIINKARSRLVVSKEYAYDRRFFLRNYSHSRENKEKIGYNIILNLHSLEKGMTSQKPRRFGTAKIAELRKLMNSLAKYVGQDDDYVLTYALGVIRGYLSFYEEHGWANTEEYLAAKEIIERFKHIKYINADSINLKKKDFISDAKIDYSRFLASRHSVRSFSKKPLEEKDLSKAVEAALLSPSACNRQMCSVYSVVNPKKRSEIIEMAQGFGGFDVDTINLLIVTFDISANYFIGERNQGWLNAGLFSMNLVNALHSIGIGSCFCQFGNSSSDEEHVKKILGIPESQRIAVLIAAGYYREESVIPRSPRKKVSSVLKIIK